MSKTVKQLVLVVVLTIVSMGVLGWVLQQLQQNAFELRASLQTIANEKAVQSEFATLSDLLAATESDRSTVASYIVDGQQGSIAFLTFIESLAERHGVELSNPSLETLANAELQTDTLRLTYQYAGSEPQVQQFLNQMSHLPFASYFESLSMRRQLSTGAGPDQLAGQFVIQVIATNITP
jgi:hypothetical protein